jgi:hypothetical protein
MLIKTIGYLMVLVVRKVVRYCYNLQFTVINYIIYNIYNI